MKAELAKELRDHENIVRLINIFYKPNKLLCRQRHVADKDFKPAGGRLTSTEHGEPCTFLILMNELAHSRCPETHMQGVAATALHRGWCWSSNTWRTTSRSAHCLRS